MKKFLATMLTAALVLTATVVPVSAASFTASVEAKTAPTITTQTTTSGTTVDAIIYDSNGDEVTGVSISDGDLVVTPLSESDSADTTISENLTTAYEQITAASDLSELCADLTDILASMTSDLTISDMVVRDLFDLTLTGDMADYLDTEGNYITLKFDLGLAEDAILLIMQWNEEGTGWEALPTDQYSIGSDGVVTVTFYHFCPVAFIVDSATVDVDYSVTSAQTGVTPNYLLFTAAGICGIGAVVCFVTGSRKSKRA